MKVALIDATVHPVETIGKMAAICYDAKTDAASNIKRATHCKDKGHLMTMRFAYATINVQGISRICSHQLVRMAHAGILQESQRYVEQSEIEFITPPSLKDMSLQIRARWDQYLVLGEELYSDSIKAKMKKEDARYCLPQSCTTQLNLCLNFQAWRDFLKNRTSKSAQWEIREMALEIEQILHNLAPEIF